MFTTARRRSPHTPVVWAARALLLLSLLLGVSAMHTLGHPPGEAHEPGGAAAAADHAESGSAEAAAAPGAAGHAGSDADSAADPPAMDPTTMCLAIVGMAIALFGLCAVAFTPWPGRLPHPARLILRSAVPEAPPIPPCLAKLQVLRI